MGWLQRHAWWGLLVFGVMAVVFGITDIASGPAADVGIPQGLTGRTIEELERESPDAYRMFDFVTRSHGWTFIILGAVLSAMVLIPFRRGERWAWWTAWLLPIWAAGVPIFYMVAGVEADQPPPPPMVSGPIAAALCGHPAHQRSALLPAHRLKLADRNAVGMLRAPCDSQP